MTDTPTPAAHWIMPKPVWDGDDCFVGKVCFGFVRRKGDGWKCFSHFRKNEGWEVSHYQAIQWVETEAMKQIGAVEYVTVDQLALKGETNEAQNEALKLFHVACKAKNDRIAELEATIEQTLDDMGKTGKCVCGAVKADLRLCLDKDANLSYSYDDALAVRIECDESHGKSSPLRAKLKGHDK